MACPLLPSLLARSVPVYTYTLATSSSSWPGHSLPDCSLSVGPRLKAATRCQARKDNAASVCGYAVSKTVRTPCLAPTRSGDAVSRCRASELGRRTPRECAGSHKFTYINSEDGEWGPALKRSRRSSSRAAGPGPRTASRLTSTSVPFSPQLERGGIAFRLTLVPFSPQLERSGRPFA